MCIVGSVRRGPVVDPSWVRRGSVVGVCRCPSQARRGSVACPSWVLSLSVAGPSRVRRVCVAASVVVRCLSRARRGFVVDPSWIRRVFVIVRPSRARRGPSWGLSGVLSLSVAGPSWIRRVFVILRRGSVGARRGVCRGFCRCPSRARRGSVVGSVGGLSLSVVRLSWIRRGVCRGLSLSVACPSWWIMKDDHWCFDNTHIYIYVYMDIYLLLFTTFLVEPQSLGLEGRDACVARFDFFEVSVYLAAVWAKVENEADACPESFRQPAWMQLQPGSSGFSPVFLKVR